MKSKILPVLHKRWHNRARVCFLLSPAQGGGMHPPHHFFLNWSPKRWADRTEILQSLWNVFCATFGKSDEVIELSRRKWSSLRSIFHQNPVSAIWLIAIDWNGPLGVIWARRWPHQSLDIISWPYECHWHWSTQCLPIMAKFAFSGVSGGPDTKDVTIFHTDRIIRHLYRFRCHSGPLAQFALGRFSSEDHVAPFRDTIGISEIFHHDAGRTSHSLRNGRENTLVSCRYD